MTNEFCRTVDALPCMIWIAGLDGQVEFVNRCCTEYSGLSVEQASGQNWLQVVHRDDYALVAAAWQRCLESGSSGEAEARMRRYDGVYRWFALRASPIRDNQGKALQWCGICTDIEDHKRAEVAVRAHEERFGLIIDGLPTGVLLVSPEGLLVHANRYGLEYFKKHIEDLGGLEDWAINDMIHPDDRLESITRFVASVKTGQPYESETRYRRYDGVYRWFRVHGFPLRDESNRIVLWYFLFTDIEERKRAEALLAGEKRLLEMVALGESLNSVLDALCELVESIDSGCHSGVLLIDPVTKTFQRGGASRLASDYIDSLQGVSIAAEPGPAATAAITGSAVVVEDIETDPRWKPCIRERVLAYGLRACWAIPISSRSNEPLGAFAIYRSEPGTPSQLQCDLIGQLNHIAGIAIERAYSDHAVKRSMEGFRAIIDTSPECVKVVARDGTLLQVNSASASIAGVPSTDVLIGKCFFDFVAPEHRRGYIEFHQHVCSGNRAVLEFDIISANGNRHHMETHAAPMEHIDGTVVQLGVTRDITARRQAEEDLRRREALMAKAQRLSSSGSFCWRVGNSDIIWSDEMYRIFGINSQTRITKDLVEVHHHADDRHLFHTMVEQLEAGLDFEYEHRLPMPDGSIKYLYTQAHATRDPQGRLEFIGATQDITDRRCSEEALGRLRAELAHVSRVNSLGALTGSIAHEINQPLGGIVTNVSAGLRMLSADPPNVDGALETLRRTLRDGRRASDVVTRLRALFSKKVLMTESVDINEAVDEVVELLRSEMRRNRILLRQERLESSPLVTGDRVQLQQVVLNLLVNAMEAMHDVMDRPRRLTVRIERGDQGHIVLAVTDAGSGIDPQHAGKLFDAFYTTKSEGMGIGLSVSRSIIESHGGQLWATSNEGPGATLTFSIPCKACGASGADRQGTPPSRDFGAFHTGGQ